MQVYTTYFAQLRKIPADKVLPVAICLYTPQWYSGVVYKKLAPTAKMLSDYKETKDVLRFQEQYTKQILGKYNVCAVLMELQRIAQNAGVQDVCLVCFEKPDHFCHRQLVRQWLQKYGCMCREYEV